MFLCIVAVASSSFPAAASAYVTAAPILSHYSHALHHYVAAAMTCLCAYVSISFVSMVSSFTSACHCCVPLRLAEGAMHVCDCHMLTSLGVFIFTNEDLQATTSAFLLLASLDLTLSSRSR